MRTWCGRECVAAKLPASRVACSAQPTLNDPHAGDQTSPHTPALILARSGSRCLAPRAVVLGCERCQMGDAAEVPGQRRCAVAGRAKLWQFVIPLNDQLVEASVLFTRFPSAFVASHQFCHAPILAAGMRGGRRNFLVGRREERPMNNLAQARHVCTAKHLAANRGTGYFGARFQRRPQPLHFRHQRGHVFECGANHQVVVNLWPRPSAMHRVKSGLCASLDDSQFFRGHAPILAAGSAA